MSLSVSVIIPVYDEEKTICATLKALNAARPDEVIVVDGGSTDRTAEIAAALARVVAGPRGRAVQMNEGARAARGDVLVFLHADTRLGSNALMAVRGALEDAAIIGGNFDIRYEGGDRTAALFTAINRLRRRWGIFYGDSGIFVRRSVFEALGGYEPWPILEDYDFARRLWRSGRLALLDEPIWVSDRRWRHDGLLRTMWTWVWIQCLYSAGVSPHRLASLYRHVR